MKSWFLKCGYPNNVIEMEMKKVKWQRKRCMIGSNLSSWFEKYQSNYQQKITPSLYG